MPNYDSPTDNPTWFQHIRFFFDSIDIDHMGQLGLDLATYDSVKSKAISIYFIYFQTKPPDARMPPEPDRKWSQARSDNFLKWIENGYPLGTPQAAEPVAIMAAAASTTSTTRIRKDIREMQSPEIDKVKAAFEGLMAKEPSDPDSYFVQAGIHWLPAPLYCLHHENRYNPWHRSYLYNPTGRGTISLGTIQP